MRFFDLREDPSRPQAGLRLPVRGSMRGWREVRVGCGSMRGEGDRKGTNT